LSLLSLLFSAVPPLLSVAVFRVKDDGFQGLGHVVREATCNPFPAPFAAAGGASNSAPPGSGCKSAANAAKRPAKPAPDMA
jgi:hypothetical protein